MTTRTFISENSRAIKILCFVGIFCLLYYQITSGKGITALQLLFQNKDFDVNPVYLVITIALMPINWWLESVKYKKLMSPHMYLTFGNSLRTVLAGISVGIVTPGRIGEYAGRLITSNPERKTEVISATLLGSIAQNLCNIIAGLMFSYFFLKSAMNVTYDNTFAFVSIVTVQILLLVYIYYHLPEVAHFIEKQVATKLTRSIHQKLKSLDLYEYSLLNIVMVISVGRYMVYFLQYFCLMRFFGAENTFIDLAGNISGIYMIQTGIPLPAFLSVMARGELAVLVWAGIGIDSISALAATFSLWFINLIIPTLAGLIVLLSSDLKKFVK